jgi:hypothetical protein
MQLHTYSFGAELCKAALADHKISWFVYASDTLIPRESSMRGRWQGDEAHCSCGEKFGGRACLRSYVRDEVNDHKWSVCFDYEGGIADNASQM